MNIKDIERLWKQATDDPHHDFNWHDPQVVKFAELVAAAERKSFYGQDKPEECADGCPENAICDYCQIAMPVQKLVAEAVAAEREDCAKVCEDYSDKSDMDHESHGYACAAIIRSRT